MNGWLAKWEPTKGMRLARPGFRTLSAAVAEAWLLRGTVTHAGSLGRAKCLKKSDSTPDRW